MTERQHGDFMEKDRAEKYLEGYNDVFADITNNLVFRKPYMWKRCFIC
ncbi:MAG: hypothetical protein PHV18_04590 [Lachnospiraceae bacterium]|nr:hypothetical protein [Lachnospiraceae bacterium]